MSSINASRNYLHDVSNALIASGYTSLDKQAKALGPQSQHGLDYRKQNNCAHSGKSRYAGIRSHGDPTIYSRATQGSVRELKLHQIIENLRSIAQECKTLAIDRHDEELSEYLREISITFSSIASVLEEYDQ